MQEAGGLWHEGIGSGVGGFVIRRALALWARIPLEAIPGSEPDKALRDAVPKLKGKLLVGVINSMGVRRDEKAVKLLVKKLDDQDALVAAAAAESLGRIGGSGAAKALKAHLTASVPAVRSASAEGCVRCAEQFMKEGKLSTAVALYDVVRQAQVPKERMLEATRGAILARKNDGLPLLIEQLRSPDKARLAIGLHTARELPGEKVTAALAAEMHQAQAERQPLLLLALAERGDPTALPTIYDAARNGSKKLRLVAVGILDRLGNPAALPVLLEVAAADDAALSQAAKSALGRLPGTGVDNEILAKLRSSQGKNRQVLFEVAGRRGMVSAVPILIEYAGSSDAGTRSAALGAIGIMGNEQEAAALVKLLQSEQSKEARADTERALIAISSRRGAPVTPSVLPLAQNDNAELRVVALRNLAAAGGPAALDAIRTATEDKEESVRDEAVNTLSSWPNTWPEDTKVAEPLLALAKSAPKPSHKVLAVRGFLQLLLSDEKMKGDEKIRRLNEVLPYVERPEDKHMAIAVLRQVHTPEALDLLVTFASQTELSDDATSALVDVAAGTKSGLSKEARVKALQAAVDKSENAATKKKAEAALTKLN